MIRLLPLLLLAAAPPARETRDPLPDQTPPPAAIADVAWLAGRWQGRGIGGEPAEEVYSAPFAGQMAGHFTQARSGGVMFYELMQIVPRGRSLAYRLKHFNADLTGWEEKGGYEDFPLVAVERDAVHFAGLSFYRIAPDRMRAVVKMEEAGKPASELTFDYRRIP